jgi:Flp pilus assembly protein TadD
VSRPLALLVLLGLPGCATLAPRSRPPSPEAHILEQVPVRAFEGDRCGPGSLALVLNANGDPVSDAALNASLPRAPGGGVLSVDLLLAARQRGFDASLVAGDAGAIRREIGDGRPVILMLKLLDLPGERRDVNHYVIVDGFDSRRQLFRLQFGDGKARWAKLERVERAWRAAGHALLVVRRRWDEAADLRRGVELEASGRLAEAAETYRSVLEAHPASARAWVNLANCEARLGKREGAESAYRKALAISPEHRDALNNLAWLLLEEGSRLEEAETLATRAAAFEGPERALARDTLGRIQLARGRCLDAATTFQQALAPSEALAPEVRAGMLEGLRQARQVCGRSEDRAR